MLLDVLDRKQLLVERDAAVEILASHAAGLPDEPSGIDWVTEWRLFTVSGFDHEEERLDLARAAVQRSLDRDWATRVWAHTAWATELREAADLAGAVEQSQRAFELVSSTREQHWYLIAACRIEALRLQGRWDDALELVDRLRTRGALDAHWWLGTMHRLLIASARGQHDAVSETAAEMWHERFPPGSGTHSDEVGLMTAFAMATAHVRDREYLASLVTMIGATDPRHVWLYADAVGFAAEQTWATDLVSDAQHAAIRRATERLDDTSLGRLWRAEILAHLRRAEAADDAEMWRDSVIGWERAGAPYLAARSRTRLAEALLVDDDRTAAAEALGQALSVADGLEAMPLADEIRTLASRARLPLPGHDPASPGSTGPLTLREHEVLQLLVQGMTNDQIGAALFISPRTASVHVSHILSKLGATNRTEVAATAHRLGLVNGA
jgi:DNA-binding CsgD family transcriptional regulator